MTLALSFAGKRVVVIGGSSGIGNAAACLFRDAGASVHITGTRTGPSDYAQSASDFQGMGYSRLDVSVPSFSADEMLNGPLDVLVNAQGSVAYGQAEFDEKIFTHVVQVNLHSVAATCRQAYPALKQSGGCVVNVGSIASFKAVPSNPAYSASKGGLLTLTKTLAAAWARDGVRVNMVAPGFVETKLTSVMTESPARYDRVRRDIPLGRWAAPLEPAYAVVFLASAWASYITGTSLLVDGGVTA